MNKCQVVFEETKTLKSRPGRPSLKVEVPNEYKSAWKTHITLAGLDEVKAKTLNNLNNLSCGLPMYQLILLPQKGIDFRLQPRS